MLPLQTSRTFITFTLAPGSISEPEVSNESYLESYLEYCCWLRVLNARQSLTILESEKSGKLERLAALAAFYQTAGLAVEDALSTYIAWSVWSRDKEQSLASILARLSLRLNEPSQPVSSNYAEEIISKLLTTKKRVDLYARSFLKQIMSVPDRDLPKVFGIPWKQYPSVKLVPKKNLEQWTTLGEFMRESIKPLLDPKGALLATCYNKIKHGPQIMIADPATTAKARGLEFDKKMASELTIRLLLQGARTQETEFEVAESTRAAPFLPMDSANAKRWFFQQVVHSANALFINGTWLYNSTYMEKKREFKPSLPELQALFREGFQYYQR